MPAELPRTVAVVGASTDRRKFGNKGVRAFVAAGWRVIPVNPNEAQVEGIATVPSVAEIDGPLDVVSLYVPAAVSLKWLPAIAAKQPGALWINPGAESGELLAEARRLGLRAVQTCSIIEVGYRPADFLERQARNGLVSVPHGERTAVRSAIDAATVRSCTSGSTATVAADAR